MPLFVAVFVSILTAVAAQVCSDDCIVREGYIVDDSACAERGGGKCIAGTCNNTEIGCTSNIDCACGCTQMFDGARRKRQLPLLAHHCNLTC